MANHKSHKIIMNVVAFEKQYMKHYIVLAFQLKKNSNE
jgi:hypothetical protein